MHELNYKYKYSNFICIKNENDFINYWIKYHLSLGFEHFYFAVDSSEKITDSLYDYCNINNDIRSYVSLFQIDGTNKSEIYVLSKGINNVSSEWIATIPIDTFLIVENNNISTLFDKVHKDCSQIILPWKYSIRNFNDYFINNHIIIYPKIQSFHSDYKPNEDYATHCCTIFKLKFFNKYLTGGHLAHMKNNKYFIVNKNFNSNDYFTSYPHKFFRNVINKHVCSVKSKYNCVVHIDIRSFDEFIIKDYFRWNSQNTNHVKQLLPRLCREAKSLDDIIYIAKNSNKEGGTRSRLQTALYLVKKCGNYDDYKDFLSFETLIDVFTEMNKKITLEQTNTNTKNSYSELIKQILETCNISIDEYNSFKNIVLDSL